MKTAELRNCWTVVSITLKDGFETEIAVGGCVTRFLRVVALDADDNAIGVSNGVESSFVSVSPFPFPEVKYPNANPKTRIFLVTRLIVSHLRLQTDQRFMSLASHSRLWDW